MLHSEEANFDFEIYRVPKKHVCHLNKYCEGAMRLIFPLIRSMNRRGFNLEFGTEFELIWQVVADLWNKELKFACRLKTRGFGVLH